MKKSTLFNPGYNKGYIQKENEAFNVKINHLQLMRNLKSHYNLLRNHG